MGKTINKDLDTKKLLDIIPETDIQIIIDAYEDMINIQKPSDIPALPEDELITIARALRNMKRGGWITQNEVKDIFHYIYFRIKNAKEGISKTNEFYKNVLKKINKKSDNARGAHKKYALEILCSSLIYVVRQKKGKPHYDVIAGFLHEQGIVRSSYAAYLKKRRSKSSIEEIMQMITALGSIRKSLSITVYPNTESGLLEDWGHSRFHDLISCLLKYKRLPA